MIQFTDRQSKIIDKAIDWYFNSSEQVFQIAGNPGTGKSVVLDEIISRITEVKKHLNIAPMAYVGAAAINMRMKGMSEARTIHSWLYKAVDEPVMDIYGRPVIDPYFNLPITAVRFVPNIDELSIIDLIVIDEGGMVPITMKPDILRFGKKVLVAGDLDQLEPIAGASAFLTNGSVEVLTEIMRQNEGSSIIYLCQRSKMGYPIHCGNYGDSLVIQKHELTDEMIAYSNIILCGRNKTREYMNKYFRHNILKTGGKLPHRGEKIICKKNNWGIQAGNINLTNGMSGIVMNEPDVATFDGKLFVVDFNPLLTNVPFYTLPIDYEYFIAPHERKQIIRTLRRPKEANQFDFGYAQTVHTSQGSQWNTGIYIEEYMKEQDRLNYTAISRFSRSCIIVKEDSKYYVGGN